MILNINDLYLMDILSFCEKHHFDLRNGPYWRLKWAISHPEMGLIALRNGQYRKAKRTFTDYGSGYITMRYDAK